jgi:hypothetical protein
LRAKQFLGQPHQLSYLLVQWHGHCKERDRPELESVEGEWILFQFVKPTLFFKTVESYQKWIWVELFL